MDSDLTNAGHLVSESCSNIPMQLGGKLSAVVNVDDCNVIQQSVWTGKPGNPTVIGVPFQVVPILLQTRIDLKVLQIVSDFHHCRFLQISLALSVKQFLLSNAILGLQFLLVDIEWIQSLDTV